MPLVSEEEECSYKSEDHKADGDCTNKTSSLMWNLEKITSISIVGNRSMHLKWPYRNQKAQASKIKR